MRDLWFQYYEECLDAGITDTEDGFRDWLFDKADLALGDDAS